MYFMYLSIVYTINIYIIWLGIYRDTSTYKEYTKEKKL